jgi:hypothetical protein
MEICGGPVYPRLFSAHSARADMCRRLGRTSEARASYEKALALTQQEPERQFLQERIRQSEMRKDSSEAGIEAVAYCFGRKPGWGDSWKW